MTRTVAVSLGLKSYDVIIGQNLLDTAAEQLSPVLNGRRPIIITDRNVAATQLERLSVGLGDVANPIILNPGESSKSWDTLIALCENLLDRGVERGDTLVALGGGVIGDLVGFAAAILKRGCHFVQIPTTLLAQVDSSVGGKTAINVRAGKNLIGSFHQPNRVLIDPTTLDTLPAREIRAGYAEVVKYGLINDREFFEWCEANAAAMIAGDIGARLHAIETSVRAKASIVAADERETRDVRALLNLGHTFGHALEADTRFSDKLLHGEAVAAGMALAFQFSRMTGRCAGQDAERVVAHLKSVGLPYDLASAGVSASGAALVEYMRHDKKMQANTLPFILAHSIGDAYVDKSVALSDVASFLDASREFIGDP